MRDEAAGFGGCLRKVYSKESHRCLLLQVHRSEGNEEKSDAHFTACRHQTKQEEQKEKGKKGKKKKRKSTLFYSYHCLPHRILG
jgi:hypothetical protein